MNDYDKERILAVLLRQGLNTREGSGRRPGEGEYPNTVTAKRAIELGYHPEDFIPVWDIELKRSVAIKRDGYYPPEVLSKLIII